MKKKKYKRVDSLHDFANKPDMLLERVIKNAIKKEIKIWFGGKK